MYVSIRFTSYLDGTVESDLCSGLSNVGHLGRICAEISTGASVLFGKGSGGIEESRSRHVSHKNVPPSVGSVLR